jgi:hypothetical protein
MKMIRFLVCFAGTALLSALSLQATPYAAGVSNNAGTVSWHLNESVTNGVVAVLFNVSAGSYAASNYLGGTQAQPVNAGPQPAFSLGSYTNFQIYVLNVGTGTPHQISPNPGTTSPDSPLVDFYGPRGVGVNRNPSSPYFGTIYVANSSPNADSVRSCGKGIYALNADFTDAFGYGSNSMPPIGTNAGQIQFGSSSTYGCYRVFVGPDDMVYIADASGGGAAGTTVGGGVWMALPNLATVTDLFPFNGTAGSSQMVCSPGTPNVTGSYAAGTLTLYTMEWNRSGPNGYQTVWQYPFYTPTNATPPQPLTFTGVGTPIPLPWQLTNIPNYLESVGTCGSTYGYGGNGNPNITVGSGIGSVDEVLGDFYIAPDGKFFCSEERSANSGTTSLWIYDTIDNGNCLLWDSLDANGGTDPFATCYGMAVSPDDKYMAMGESSASGNPGNDSQILICGLDTQPASTGNNVAGLPDVSTITLIPYGAGDSLRGVAWDLADNVYSVSGSDDSMRAFTLGASTLAVTGNDTTGTNGTFSLTYPGTTATVTTSTPLISQTNTLGNPLSGTFVITLAAAQSSPVTVPFGLGGTATNGVSYTLTGTGLTTNKTAGSIVFSAGQTTATITITPVAGGSAATLTASLSLVGSASVSPAPPVSATIAIANTGPQAISITSIAAPSLYRGLSNDYAAFIITRYGDTNAAAYNIPANAFSYAGTATVGVDYAAIGPVTVNPGDQTETVQVSDPVATGIYHGNETILVTLNTNAPVPVVPGSANMTLVDNADPPAPVLWSNPLTNAADSTNWTLTFANSNLGPTTVPPIVIPKYPNYTTNNPDPNGFPNGTGLDDFDVEFGYNVTSDDVGYSPMMLLNGWTNALKMTVNKIINYVPIGTTGGGCSAGVNVYPAGMNFSGNYAFRFSMNLSEGTTYTTEYNSFGINHYGTNCNWFSSDYSYGSGTTNSDGDWFWIDADVDGQTGINTYIMAAGPPLPNTGWALLENVLGFAPPYTNDFKHPPYNGYPAGVPNDGNGGAANEWADVEVKQVNNVITLSINKFPILAYTNTAYATSGEIMLGYDDPFASVGNVAGAGVSGAAVYYSNARVVQLTPPAVSSSSLVGSTLTINFTDSDTDDTAASFELLGSSALNGTFAKVAAAFSQSTSGAWQAVVTVPSGTVSEFYKVVRLN